MTKASIQRSHQFGLEKGVAEVVGSRFAYPGRIVRGFAAVDPMGFVGSQNFAVVVAEAPAAEHTLETLAVEMDCRNLTSTRFAGFEEG